MFLGRFDVPKQPLMLPEIVRCLESRLPAPDWRLAIAGFGPMEDALRQKIAQAGVGHRIHFIGSVPAAPPICHASDVLVQPSLWEGLPLAVVEAHAAGMPVVGSQITGIREVVTADTGVLCPAHDADSFAAGLATLLEDRALRERMSQAARRRAQQYFDGNVNMRRVMALYDELLGLNTQRFRKLAA